MTDREQVKNALTALAEDATTESDSTTSVPEHDGPGRQRTGLNQATSAEPPAVDETCTYRNIITQAQAAVDDLDAAVEFIECVGVDELAAAVERAEHEVSGLAADGRDALAAFREFRRAATDDDHFDRGHDTSIRDPGIPPDR